MRLRPTPFVLAVSLSLFASVAVAGDDASSSGDLEVFFDIKPAECPNPSSPQWGAAGSLGVPTVLLGTDELAARAFNAMSIILVLPGGGGQPGEILLPPIGTSFVDQATPFAGPDPCDCTAEGPDGTEDLAVRFDGPAVLDALSNFPAGDEVEICIRGELLDGTPFTSCDCVFLLQPLPVTGSSWSVIKASYR